MAVFVQLENNLLRIQWEFESEQNKKPQNY